MAKTLLPFIILCLACSNVFGQSAHVTGRILADDPSQTPLSNANVLLEELERGTSTNLQGFFTFYDIQPGTYSLKVSYLGYRSVDTLISVPLTEDLLIRMSPESAVLDPFLVVERGESSDLLEQSTISSVSMSAEQILTSPRLFGEPDLVRRVQQVPGVKVDTDYSTGFHVRGGRQDQNLILLDGMPVYNTGHLFGIFSMFNTESVSNVEFNKGVFSSRFGSRLSSVLSVRLKDGEEHDGFGNINISGLSTSLSYGRAVNQNTSYLLTFRRTYMDPVFWIIDAREEKNVAFNEELDQSTRYNFLDGGLKVIHRFSDRSVLDVTGFYSSDVLNMNSVLEFEHTYTSKNQLQDYENTIDDNSSRFGWRNMAGSARLTQRLGMFRLTNQVFATYYSSTNYDRTNFFDYWTGSRTTTDGVRLTHREVVEETSYLLDKNFDQSILDIGYKTNLRIPLFNNHRLDLGGEAVRHGYSRTTRFFEFMERDRAVTTNDYPPQVEFTTNETNMNESFSINPVELASYANAKIDFDRLVFFPGVRLDYYVPGSYLKLNPRLNISIKPFRSAEITAGYGRFSQYRHTVGYDVFQFPTEGWFWAGKEIDPAEAVMLTLGAGYKLGDIGRFTVEWYDKSLSNLRAFSPLDAYKTHGSTGILVPVYPSETVSGQGEARGIETTFEKTIGRLTGWAGYTLSRTRHQFDEINGGEWYYARTDSRHDLSFSLSLHAGSNVVMGSAFNFKSGQPITLAYSAYAMEQDPLGTGRENETNPLVYLQHNNHRLPDYHRLDVFVTLKNRKLFGVPAEFSLSIINVYNRFNIFAVNSQTGIHEDINFYEVNPDNRIMSQLPVLPMVSLHLLLNKDK